MPDRFDPYYQWLGIAAKDQPPNHYRLLGIDPLEASADVIEHAADRQMAHLRSLQSGKHAEEAQRLLNEIAAAKVLLLDEGKKQSYDARLRREITTNTSAAARPLRVAEPLVMSQAPEPIDTTAALPSKPKPAPTSTVTEKHASPAIAVAAAGAIALVVVAALGAGALWIWLSAPQDTRTANAGGGRGETAVAHVATGERPLLKQRSVADPAPKSDESTTGGTPIETDDESDPSRIRLPNPPDDGQLASEPNEDNQLPAEDEEPLAALPIDAIDPDSAPNAGDQLAHVGDDDVAASGGNEATEPVQRSPVPNKALREAKRKEIITIFQPAEAKSIEQKQELVDRLMETARDTTGDVAGRFALLNLARDVACDAGDIERSFATVEAMDGAFAIDALNVKAACIEQASQATMPKDAREKIVAAGGELIDELFAADKYKESAALITTLQQVARPLRDKEILADLSRRRSRGAELYQHYARASAALDTLTQDAENPEANAAAGKYVALAKGDWQRGLPLLAKGKDETLSQIAAQEMADPKTAGEQAKLADAWWNAAEEQPELLQRQMQRHALDWYQSAAPSLTGLDAARVNARIAEAAEMGLDEVAGAASDQEPPDSGAGNTEDEIEWAEVPEDGMLSRALALGPFPKDADDRLIVTFLSKAKRGNELGGRKFDRQLAEQSGKFRGSLVQQTEKFYVFRIHSEREQAALLIAETFTNWSHSTVDVMVNYRPGPRHGQVLLARGDNIIIVKHNHNKSDRDDRSWVTISLQGEGLRQGY